MRGLSLLLVTSEDLHILFRNARELLQLRLSKHRHLRLLVHNGLVDRVLGYHDVRVLYDEAVALAHVQL